MSLTMPKPEAEILANRQVLIKRLQQICPHDGGVIWEERKLKVYECDALTMYRQLPLVVTLPETVDQVSRIMALAQEMNVKIVPRGAGTSLSGGSLPLEDGILLGMSKFNRVLEIDWDNRAAVVQPGVTNLAITQAVEHEGFYLRARSVIPDRLFDRRQCRRKFGRGALPEIRTDDQQHSGH